MQDKVVYINKVGSYQKCLKHNLKGALQNSFIAPSWDGKVRGLFICNQLQILTNIWYKKSRLGINSISSMMKDLISNSLLQNSEKHLANHSARKAL